MEAEKQYSNMPSLKSEVLAQASVLFMAGKKKVGLFLESFCIGEFLYRCYLGWQKNLLIVVVVHSYRAS